MATLDLYSHRKKVAEGEIPDTYEYNMLPTELRNQIARIWRNSIGEGRVYETGEFFERRWRTNGVWRDIHESIAQEHGRRTLGHQRDLFERCVAYLNEMSEDSIDKALDLVEFSFRQIDEQLRESDRRSRGRWGINQQPDEAIGELNERFRRAGLGYQFEDGIILRIDSDLMHSETVLPALKFLREPGFEGPRQEFLAALEHRRKGNLKEATTSANNAFESTMKAICVQRQWKYSNTSEASKLVRVMKDNDLLPNYLEGAFDKLLLALTTVRSNSGGHGQGPGSTRHSSPCG